MNIFVVLFLIAVGLCLAFGITVIVMPWYHKEYKPEEDIRKDADDIIKGRFEGKLK